MNRYVESLTDEQFASLPLSERFVLVAAHLCDKVKVQEHPHGSNRGPELDAWAHELGIGVGQPWCGTFVTICLKRAGYKGPFPPNPASTHSWADWARLHGHTAQTAQRGDVFVLLYTAKTGHMGAILSNGAPVRTIEGNSNDDGSREGYEVVRHARTIKPSPKKVIVRLPGS